MLLQKQLKTKLHNQDQKYNKLKAKSKGQSDQIRYCRTRIRDLTQSRANWKTRAKSAEGECKALVRAQKQFFSEGGRIAGHTYCTLMVSFCIRLYTLCGCSLRGVVSVLEMVFPNKKIPCKSTVSNWLRKCGYHVYTQNQNGVFPKGYTLILDESMVIGQERMMMALAVGAQKTKQHALRLFDVSVAMLKVCPTWNAETLKEFINEISSQMGEVAKYVVCDGDTKIQKALKELNLVRIHDIGHEISTLLRKAYEKAIDFTTFTRELSQVRFREIMKPTAYLLPSKARTNSRFMNLSHQVKWATNILQAWSRLSKEEKKIFASVKTHKKLILELGLVFEIINPILELIKTEGLARATVLKVYKMLRECRNKTTLDRTRNLLAQIRAYFWNEVKKLPQPQICYHASSDIIESAFGLFKTRKSPNSLNGVTPSVLFIPLMTKIDTEKKKLNFCVKKALESISTKDIEKWDKDYLIPNQVARRIKTLKKRRKNI